MRISAWLWLIVWLMCMLGWSTHAAIYLDELNNRDISSNQNTIISSGSTSLPASKPIVLDEITITMANTNTGTKPSTGTIKTISTGTTSLSGSTSGVLIIEDTNEEAEQTNPINQLPELQRDAEFLMSLRWLYEQGITKFQDPEKFMPENYLSRVDAAKMLSVLSRKVFGNTKLNSEACAYTDVRTYDDTTKWQLVAVLIRMFDRKVLDENTTPWYKNYVQRWWEIWLLWDRSTAGMDETVSRLDVSKMLYKLRNIYLNTTPIVKNETPLFIHIVINGSSGSYQALIDTAMLRDDYLNTLEMKLDTVTYYFSKDKIYNYGATLSSFQVYGYIYASSESITPIGVGTRRVQRWVIQEWNLVIWWTPQTTYNITPNKDASLYVILKKE
jgi:hypothetical protein